MIQQLHSTWAKSTGISLPLDAHRQQQWEDWIRVMAPMLKEGNYRPGYTLVDALKDIIAFRRAKFAHAPDIMQNMLAFRYLVGNPDYCQEDLATAHALSRSRGRIADKESVLKATGRGSKCQSEPRTAGQVLASTPEPLFKELVAKMKQAVDDA